MTKIIRKKSNIYFGKQLQNIIIQYINSNDQAYRDKLYTQHINAAFKKIASSLVNKYHIQSRLQNSEIITLECISFMIQKMPLFDSSRGRAFSFFTVVAKNFILNALNKGIKHNERFTSLNYENKDKQQVALLDQCSHNSWTLYQQTRKNNDVINKTVENLISFIQQQFVKTRKTQGQTKICWALIQIMQDSQHLVQFNKKVVFLYIRELTNESSEIISRVLKQLTKHYYKIKQDVIDNHTDQFYDIGE